MTTATAPHLTHDPTAEAPAPHLVPTPILDQPLTVMRPFRPEKLRQLSQLGIHTLRDLFYHIPREYDDRRLISPVTHAAHGERQCFRGYLSGVRPVNASRQISSLRCQTSGATLHLHWFGQKHLIRAIPSGTLVQAHGTVFNPDPARTAPSITGPDFDIIPPEDTDSAVTPMATTGRIVPVYPLTRGINQNYMRNLLTEAAWAAIHQIESVQPAPTIPTAQAIRDVHFPPTPDDAQHAINQLASDELFELQLAILMRRHHRDNMAPPKPLRVNPQVATSLTDLLPYSLTQAQTRSIDEVLQDLQSHGPPMNRLLQGDVGSGKTAVALAAALFTASAGSQTTLMVPTESLAEQHFSTITTMLSAVPVPMSDAQIQQASITGLTQPFRFALLTGNTRAKQRRNILAHLELGTIDLLIGTHALIQPDIAARDLALAIVDEQHRFGVGQRSVLRQDFHYLMLTATPIPRTMQLTIYRDLDISTLDEMPPGRLPVQTNVLDPAKSLLPRCYQFIRDQTQQGYGTFIIYPLINEGQSEAPAAEEEFPTLRDDVFPDLRLDIVHGRMKHKDKEAAIAKFRDGQTDVLVATSVVEVGIDIPHASVILINGAERFGLAQMHQFRGRVGRSTQQSYCFLHPTHALQDCSDTVKRRLNAMRTINDGMKLAEMDLRIRGQGDIWGHRQSGQQQDALRVAHAYDLPILEHSTRIAEAIHQNDPTLQSPDHANARAAVGRMLARLEAAAVTDH